MVDGVERAAGSSIECSERRRRALGPRRSEQRRLERKRKRSRRWRPDAQGEATRTADSALLLLLRTSERLHR